MIRIEPEQWLSAVFARAVALADVLRHPTDDYAALSAEEQDRLRQSQIEANEVVRVLGFRECHALVMKADRVLGWVAHDAIAVDAAIGAFAPMVSPRLSAAEFFGDWHGTRYVWGGITRAGIDCSGFTQRYYRDVLERGIPKNTYDQRRAGESKELAAIAEHDLVFCTRIGGRGIHHVGIYVAGDIWHAHGERGVISQPLQEFLTHYQVLDVVAFGATLSNKRV